MGWRDELSRYPRFAPDFEIDARRAALISIDMQYLDAHADYGLGLLLRDRYPQLHQYFVPRMQEVVVPNIARLLGFFREHKLRVIFITIGPMLEDGSDYMPLKRSRYEAIQRETGRRQTLFPPDSFERRILVELEPQKGELVLNKVSSGAFNSTALDRVLRNLGIEALVITGVLTNGCVETTARDAADRSYKCVLVDDACGTISQDLHDATMRSFALVSGKVATTAETLQLLRQSLAAARVPA